MALALLIQTTPSTDVIDNLPDMQDHAAITLSPDVQPLKILDHPVGTARLGAPSAAGVEKTPNVYYQVNLVLEQTAGAAGVTTALTSYSFRRGGAQHTNGSGELTVRYIFDKGAWNMITTNKGFSYILNTSTEAHKASKMNNTTSNVTLQDLNSFDSQTKNTISSVPCSGEKLTRT